MTNKLDQLTTELIHPSGTTPADIESSSETRQDLRTIKSANGPFILHHVARLLDAVY